MFFLFAPAFVFLPDSNLVMPLSILLAIIADRAQDALSVVEQGNLARLGIITVWFVLFCAVYIFIAMIFTKLIFAMDQLAAKVIIFTLVYFGISALAHFPIYGISSTGTANGKSLPGFYDYVIWDNFGTYFLASLHGFVIFLSGYFYWVARSQSRANGDDQG